MAFWSSVFVELARTLEPYIGDLKDGVSWSKVQGLLAKMLTFCVTSISLELIECKITCIRLTLPMARRQNPKSSCRKDRVPIRVFHVYETARHILT